MNRGEATTPHPLSETKLRAPHVSGWNNPWVIHEYPAGTIREARSDEFALLRSIEFEADRMFETVGIGPFVNDDAENHFSQAALVLVVGHPPVGFVCVELVDEVPHIWQLAVLPDHGRQGLGSALVRAACEWARLQLFDAITLTTYRDVPWNGPFYESLGFVTMGTLTPELIGIREHERAVGDDDFGPRVAMRLAL
jgi:ribosomal protein S18 acetylase RimI-like enzyme